MEMVIFENEGWAVLNNESVEIHYNYKNTNKNTHKKPVLYFVPACEVPGVIQKTGTLLLL